MIPRKRPAWQTGEWRTLLSEAVRDVDELWRLLRLPPERLPAARAAARSFPLRLPRPYLHRIPPGDPDDPLLRQFLPQGEETVSVPGFVADPVGDGAAVESPGLLRKYAGRVLVITTGACPVHCRYCFRRHFPYGEQRIDEAILTELDDTVDEVILSGGDPLTLSVQRLKRLESALPGGITLRIHSRIPVTLPQRIDDEFLAWLETLQASGRSTVLVIHANHPRELDETVAEAITLIRERGVILLNQTVLLRGVNDTIETLAELSRRLFRIGVLPYYLHLLDPVAGAAHFQVETSHATALMEALRACLPGYLVPRLVREVPGAPNKLPVS